MTTIQIVGALLFLVSGTLLLRDYKNYEDGGINKTGIFYILCFVGMLVGMVMLFVLYGI